MLLLGGVLAVCGRWPLVQQSRHVWLALHTCALPLRLVLAQVNIVRIQGSTTSAAGGITVTGTWSSTGSAISSWPYTATAISSNTASTRGRTTFTSTRTVPSRTGNGCSFVVTGVRQSSTTLTLNPSLTLAQRTGRAMW